MGRKRRGLRPEEVDLWNRVARTASPLHPDRTSAAEIPSPERKSLEPPAPKAELTGFRIGARATETTGSNRFEPHSTQRPVPRPARMDAKAFDRMKRGKLRVEGRIDLHGLTLAEAQPRLVSFILSSHARGRRLVLVITGKGRDLDAGDAVPMRRGLLREQVPRWLGAGALRGIVLEVAEAHRRHGGSGAFYVYLRRK